MPATPPASARICRGCWDQMHMPIPIRGLLAIPLRIVGITQSKMNICTVCERSFRFVQKRRRITADATILFADMRGFTSLSEEVESFGVERDRQRIPGSLRRGDLGP